MPKWKRGHGLNFDPSAVCEELVVDENIFLARTISDRFPGGGLICIETRARGAIKMVREPYTRKQAIEFYRAWLVNQLMQLDNIEDDE